MSVTFPKVYRSFSEFEQSELRKLDPMGTGLDDLLLGEPFAARFEGGADSSRGRRRRAGDRGTFADWD
jgi:hypothetical protein